MKGVTSWVGALFVCAACGPTCPPSQSLVVVDPDQRRLYGCHDGEVEISHRVSIGRNGAGKQRVGDGRTPNGRYPLHRVEPSPNYTSRMAIGDRRGVIRRGRRLVGTRLYVHGPKASLSSAWRGPASLVDWTEGCVALPSVAEMRAVGAWARRRGAREILIERGSWRSPRLRAPVGWSSARGPVGLLGISERFGLLAPAGVGAAGPFVELEVGGGARGRAPTVFGAARPGFQHRSLYGLSWGAAAATYAGPSGAPGLYWGGSSAFLNQRVALEVLSALGSADFMVQLSVDITHLIL